MPILRSLAYAHILLLPVACLWPTEDAPTILRCICADGFGSAVAQHEHVCVSQVFVCAKEAGTQ